jgi:hypothetical protein
LKITNIIGAIVQNEKVNLENMKNGCCVIAYLPDEINSDLNEFTQLLGKCSLRIERFRDIQRNIKEDIEIAWGIMALLFFPWPV